MIATIIFILFWSLLVGYLASRTGRTWLFWFIVSLIISPLLSSIALLIVRLIYGKKPKQVEAVKVGEPLWPGHQRIPETEEGTEKDPL